MVRLFGYSTFTVCVDSCAIDFHGSARSNVLFICRNILFNQAAARISLPSKNGEKHLKHLIRNVTKVRARGKTPRALLAELASLRLSFSSGAAMRKLALFEALAELPLPSAADVLKLH